MNVKNIRIFQFKKFNSNNKDLKRIYLKRPLEFIMLRKITW